mmetsp:Transcript_6238/g.15168  ORF Transcript_6238/g.15168 Transcript_6238/m.15168 type:complete len:320 (-) Transcript_6238:61-1020(-)
MSGGTEWAVSYEPRKRRLKASRLLEVFGMLYSWHFKTPTGLPTDSSHPEWSIRTRGHAKAHLQVIPGREYAVGRPILRRASKFHQSDLFFLSYPKPQCCINAIVLLCNCTFAFFLAYALQWLASGHSPLQCAHLHPLPASRATSNAPFPSPASTHTRQTTLRHADARRCRFPQESAGLAAEVFRVQTWQKWEAAGCGTVQHEGTTGAMDGGGEEEDGAEGDDAASVFPAAAAAAASGAIVESAAVAARRLRSRRPATTRRGLQRSRLPVDDCAESSRLFGADESGSGTLMRSRGTAEAAARAAAARATLAERQSRARRV